MGSASTMVWSDQGSDLSCGHRDGDGALLSSPSRCVSPGTSFEEFYARESAAIVRFARSKAGDQQAAEDLAAETLTLMFSRWGQLRGWLDEPGGELRLRGYA